MDHNRLASVKPRAERSSLRSYTCLDLLARDRHVTDGPMEPAKPRVSDALGQGLDAINREFLGFEQGNEG